MWVALTAIGLAVTSWVLVHDRTRPDEPHDPPRPRRLRRSSPAPVGPRGRRHRPPRLRHLLTPRRRRFP